MSIWGIWGRSLGRIAKAYRQLPKKSVKTPVDPTAIRAREILATIRRGEYEFSSSELNEILKRTPWLGRRQSWFESIEAISGQQVKLKLAVPLIGQTTFILRVTDLWHDPQVSSLDFQIMGIELTRFQGGFLIRFFERVAIGFVYLCLRWNGSWRNETMRFVVPSDRMIRLYIDWTDAKSPLIDNINVIGVQIQCDSVVFYTFRRPVTSLAAHSVVLADVRPVNGSTFWNRLAVLLSWLLLGAYAFVLIHVTLPVLNGAFRLMPQDAKAVHIWILKQTYNLLVILLSYFFLRITMLPLYVKWNKSKEELATLISLESRDHEYLRPLTEMVRKMQGGGTSNVPTETIAQMIELMSSIRELSHRRLLGMTQMRRGWLQDLIVGYLFIFSLEWMYYSGHLTPLSVSIQWVNRIMARFLLYE